MALEKDKTGVVIGRFQPVHKGHAWLIKKASEKFNKLIIIIGSSNREDNKNLWSLSTRRKMIEKFLEEEGLKNNILKIEDVTDVPDDNYWLEKTLEKIGEKDFTVVGDNEWVNKIFENAGYKVWRPGHYKRNDYEGETIRSLYLKNQDWENRVPYYIKDIIRSD